MAAKPPVEKLATELDPESEQFGLLYDPARTGDWIESFLTIPNEHGTIVKMNLFPQQHQMLANQTVIPVRQRPASPEGGRPDVRPGARITAAVGGHRPGDFTQSPICDRAIRQYGG